MSAADTIERAALGDNVRTARMSAGLSQRDLAGTVGVSQATIAKIESGETENTRHIVSVAKALGTTAEDLVADGYARPRPSVEADGRRGPSAPVRGAAKSCPVEAIGREMKALVEADDQSHLSCSPAWKQRRDTFGVRIARADLIGLRDTLADLASYRAARSVSGAMVLLAIASGDMTDVIDEGKHHDDPKLVGLESRESATRARRCLYSVMRFLEDCSGLRRESIGAEYTMAREIDPHLIRNLLVAGEFDEAVVFDENADSGLRKPESARDPLADLIRTCREGMEAVDSGDAPEGDSEETEFWRDRVGRHLDRMASDDCPSCETYDGALKALQFVLAFPGDIAPRNAILVERALACLERLYPDHLFDRAEAARRAAAGPDPLLDLMRRREVAAERKGLSDEEFDALFGPLHEEMESALPATSLDGVLAALRYGVPDITGFDRVTDGVLRAALAGLEAIVEGRVS